MGMFTQETKKLRCFFSVFSKRSVFSVHSFKERTLRALWLCVRINPQTWVSM